jgi:hypothetical protein
MAATLREVLMDSRETPDGVHQEAWLGVTTSYDLMSTRLRYLITGKKISNTFHK